MKENGTCCFRGILTACGSGQTGYYLTENEKNEKENKTYCFELGVFK